MNVLISFLIAFVFVTHAHAGPDPSYGATLTPAMPEGAVEIPAAPGALAAAIVSHGPHTTFFLRAGVHTGNAEMRPKTGSVIIGEAGAILDGGNVAKHCFQHDPGVIPYAASAPRYVVTLRNLVVRKYAPPDQQCAVMAEGSGMGWGKALSDAADRNGWLVDHCAFVSNRAGGLFLGSASTARNCLASANGQVGFKATGRRAELLDCRSTGNNPDRQYNYFVEAGGVKCWSAKDLLVECGEYDHNGGFGLWTDYTWDGNVIRNASFHDNLRAGVSIEMTVGAEIAQCEFRHNDTDGMAGRIPPAFRPWDKSPASGPDLWTGEIFLFDACASGTLANRDAQAVQTFTGRTWIHNNRIANGGGGIVMLYQDRGGVTPSAVLQGSKDGPIAGLRGIVIEDNDIDCSGYAGSVNILANRDYSDAGGSWGPIPAAQAKEEFEAPIHRHNRYSESARFCVPKAAMRGGGDSVWDWNDRADVDLSQWQEMGKDRR
ncbi:MAG: right-handed parallel beta-helix repeat-containing protein [Candidatus Sumerlaeota bacterium]|nr:right-handed parallel beta-helix repeat-containing protein [Candidatus Sumerlaeota bacterium]